MKAKVDYAYKVTQFCQQYIDKGEGINILDLYNYLCWLERSQLEKWKSGHAQLLGNLIQVGQKKQRHVIRHFIELTKPFQYFFSKSSTVSLVRGIVPYEIGDLIPELQEQLFRVYLPTTMTERKKANLEKKLAKASEFRFFTHTGKTENCIKCKRSFKRKELYYEDNYDRYCLNCIGYNDLILLPCGDATRSRRAKKYSARFAEVMEYNPRSRRYERRGILVEAKAIELADASCLKDADSRAKCRKKAYHERQLEDVEYIFQFSRAIRKQFPLCPVEEVYEISKHATERNSGRVGRTAAAKEFNQDMIRLAVIAYIRHKHTPYDRILASGTSKDYARKKIMPIVKEKLKAWS